MMATCQVHREEEGAQAWELSRLGFLLCGADGGQSLL